MARRLQPAVQRVRATPVQRWFTGVRSGVGYVGGLWGRYVGCGVQLSAWLHGVPAWRQAGPTMPASQTPLHLQTRGPLHQELCIVSALLQTVSRGHVLPQVLIDGLTLQAEWDSWAWQ